MLADLPVYTLLFPLSRAVSDQTMCLLDRFLVSLVFIVSIFVSFSIGCQKNNSERKGLKTSEGKGGWSARERAKGSTAAGVLQEQCLLMAWPAQLPSYTAQLT